MKKTLFEHELSKAKTLSQYGKDGEKEFWLGYKLGLRRRYHGEKFRAESDHQKWLSLVDDESNKEARRGYRSGFYGPVRLATDHPQSSYGIPVFVGAENNPMDYVDGMIALREWWGLDALAEASGVSVRTVEGWCIGRMPGTDSLLKLMAALK